jgi:hypothetical protein
MIAVAFVFGGWTVQIEATEQVPRMTKEDLKTNLNNPDLKLIDVRVDKSYTSSQRKIERAVREAPDDLMAWSKKYPKSSRIVLTVREAMKARVPV